MDNLFAVHVMDFYSVSSFIPALIALFSLVGLFCISSLSYLGFKDRKEFLKYYLAQDYSSYFGKIYRRIFQNDRPESFLFVLSISKYILLSIFIVFTLSSFLGDFSASFYIFMYAWMHGFELFKLLSISALLLLLLFSFSDLIPRALSFYFPSSLFRFIKNPASFFLLLTLPFSFFFYRLIKLIFPKDTFSVFSEPKEEIIELLREYKGGEALTIHEKRLIESVFHFRTRVAREIMKPRVELFCINEDLSLQEAAHLLEKEGYSRVPVYKDTIDTIVGVLFYRDVLAKYVEASESLEKREALLSQPVKNFVRGVYYCPETKRISSLLQELRKRKTHLAVIVDEYGGTAGIVTIEDILEELVGEIADEYDEQEVLLKRQPDGSFIIDARMNLLDLEEEIGIKIPQEEDYDTIAGYIFYRLGSIPKAGLHLHHDNFELEILKSNDRMVEEIRLIPLT
jgi:putative hemolysin